MNCPACSAPVAIPPGAGQAQCSYCGSTLRVQRSDGEVALLASEQVSRAIADSHTQTQAAIGEISAATRSELRQMQLAQERSNLELRLANIQGEMRAVQRMPSNKLNRQQLQQLGYEQTALQQRIAEIDAILYPEGVAEPAPARSSQRGCIGWTLLVLAWLFFWPFLLPWTMIRSQSRPIKIAGYVVAVFVGLWVLSSLFAPRSSRTRETSATATAAPSAGAQEERSIPTANPPAADVNVAAAAENVDNKSQPASAAPAEPNTESGAEPDAPVTTDADANAPAVAAEAAGEALADAAADPVMAEETAATVDAAVSLIQRLPTATPEPPDATPAPVIGQDVVFDTLRYRVLEAVDAGQTLQSDNQFIEPASTAGRFVRVVFEVENLQKDQAPFLGVDLVDAQGREYGAYSEGMMYVAADSQCAFTMLNPNLPQTCESIFEAPANATGLMLKVTDQVPLLGQEALIDLGL